MTTLRGQDDPSQAVWRKSSRSNGGEDACVEVACVDSDYALRDSKDPRGPVLLFGGEAWKSFLDQVKDGAYGL